MSTVIVTPLFPPDPSDSARYVKLLASKLPTDALTVIAYGSLPESVTGVDIIPISKRSYRFVRIWRCLRTLLQLRPTLLIVQNGPSAELPALVYSYIRRTKLIYIVSDQRAAAKPHRLAKHLRTRAVRTILLPTDTMTHLPTEWLPFADNSEPTDQPDGWWPQHISHILHDSN